MKQYVGALLITPNNEIIMQQRDDKPGIVNPGMITTFGGGVENGENINEAIKRELREELELVVSDIQLFGIFYKTKEIHGEDCECNIYIIRNINPENIVINEGRGFALVNKNNYNTLKLGLLAKQIAGRYFSNFKL